MPPKSAGADPLVRIDRAMLAELMRARGMSAFDLARRSRVSDQALYSILRDRPGRGKPTQSVRPSTAHRIADALGVSAGALEQREGANDLQAPGRAAAAIAGADAERFRELLGAPPSDGAALRALLLNLQARAEQAAGEAETLPTSCASMARTRPATYSVAPLWRSAGSSRGAVYRTKHLRPKLATARPRGRSPRPTEFATAQDRQSAPAHPAPSAAAPRWFVRRVPWHTKQRHSCVADIRAAP
jgi:transcriptional regulator with XRE-family HTH domain